MNRVSRFLGGSIVFLSVVAVGCGYSLQTSDNKELVRRGIRRIYVMPVQNASYKPGVENLVYNELVKILATRKQVRVVNRIEDSDAILQSEVLGAEYVSNARTRASSVFPANDKRFLGTVTGDSNTQVSTEYLARLTCEFKLMKRSKVSEPDKKIWSGNFGRSKVFPASNQLGVFGTTGPLINESEFDRALQDMAQSMSADLHESMLTLF